MKDKRSFAENAIAFALGVIATNLVFYLVGSMVLFVDSKLKDLDQRVEALEQGRIIDEPQEEAL